MRKKLIKLRKIKNLTQEETALAVSISRAYYGRIETGERNPSLEVSMRIKKFFNYCNDDIFFNSACDKTANNVIKEAG